MYEKFGDYMYSLLFTPLRKGKKALNQFYILFKVTGRLYDDTKTDVFRVRREAMVATASVDMLPEHGKDRYMPRLKGEGDDGYRRRLAMKAIIAKMAGTVPGLLLALTSLGYGRSYIEPMYLHDPERWAEFLVFLAGDGEGVDLRAVDSEIMRIKEASSMPAYATEQGSRLEIHSHMHGGTVTMPICNTLYCGTWPVIAAHGSHYPAELQTVSASHGAEVYVPITNTLYNGTYPEPAAEGRHFSSRLEFCESGIATEVDHPVTGGTIASGQERYHREWNGGRGFLSTLEMRSGVSAGEEDKSGQDENE